MKTTYSYPKKENRFSAQILSKPGGKIFLVHAPKKARDSSISNI
jgi:hypothetical protein